LFVVLGTGIQTSLYELLLLLCDGECSIGISDLIAEGTDIVESLTTVPESKLDLDDEILTFCGRGGVVGFERIAICGDPTGYVAEAGAEDFLGLYLGIKFCHLSTQYFFFQKKVTHFVLCVFRPLTKSTKLERNFGVLLLRKGLSERCLILSLSHLLKDDVEDEGLSISEKFCSELLVAGIPSVAARSRAEDGDIGGNWAAAVAAARSDFRLLIFKCFILEL
jgi:hypothetical protein